MDFHSLTPENQAKYKALEELIFSHPKIELKTNCKKIEVPYWLGFMWYSHMLKNRPAPLVEAPVMPFKTNLPLCPSCGKLRSEVTDMITCRDIFHYL
jgi:hypothetical protein